MSLEFTVAKTRQTLEKQWAYIAKRGEDNTGNYFKRLSTVMLVLTGFYLLLYFFTADDDFIIVKGVGFTIIPVLWIALLITGSFSGIRKRKRQRKFTQFLSSVTDDRLNYSVKIDEEKVIIKSAIHTYELLWTEFHRYGIYNETLYIFNDLKGINSLFWDEQEIGVESYKALLDLLQKKAYKKMF